MSPASPTRRCPSLGNRQATLLACAIVLLTLATPALAMRCGTQLVLEGMTRYEVRERCGEPHDISRRYTTVYRHISATESIAREVEVEQWYYDLGSNRLNRRLTFIDGRLQKREVAN